MRKIDNYFLILFLTADINEPNFRKFIEHHLSKLKANNPGGKYDALIAALTLALGNHVSAIELRDWNYVQQQAATIIVDDFIASFKSHVSGRHFEIIQKWPEGSATYQLFYPNGIEEYYTATKGNISSKMTRFLSACDAKKADLPSNFAIPFISFKSSFDTSRLAQLDLIAATDASRLAVKLSKEALALQATRNVHTLGMDFAGQPEMAKQYFDQSILRRPVSTNGGEPEPEVLSDVVAPHSSETIMEGGFDAATVFRIVNSGSVTIRFYTTHLPSDLVPPVTVELAPGEEDEVAASELGAEGNLFFMAFNDSDTPGSYEITIME
jgi:hypothetical protein